MNPAKEPQHGFGADFQVVTVRDQTLNPFLAPGRNMVVPWIALAEFSWSSKGVDNGRD
jgi:hypothetical protein